MNEQDNIQKVEFFFLILIPKSIPLYTIFIACISSCAVLATFVTAQGPFEKKKSQTSDIPMTVHNGSSTKS